MPNLNDTKIDIESHIDTNVSGILPIAYDNIPFENDGLDKYVYLVVQFTSSSNINIGSIISKRIRHTGSIIFKLYTKIDLGTTIPLSTLDSIKTQVENRYISTNLITYAAEPARKGIGKDGYYSYFLSIPFVSDEC